MLGVPCSLLLDYGRVILHKCTSAALHVLACCSPTLHPTPQHQLGPTANSTAEKPAACNNSFHLCLRIGQQLVNSAQPLLWSK